MKFFFDVGRGLLTPPSGATSASRRGRAALGAFFGEKGIAAPAVNGWSRPRRGRETPPYIGSAGCAVVAFFAATAVAAEPWVHEKAGANDVTIVSSAAAAPIVYAADDAAVVRIAASDLAKDIERVSGKAPVLTTEVPAKADTAILVGTLGQSAVIDALVASGKLKTDELRGAWESFIIATVADPSPTIARALVIVGSDRRGTAYGIYELSQAIGISPWHWWADVAPAHRDALHVSAGVRRFGPPSVKYRGIFINDEDWGLQPWAAKTFEPENGGIGPKTYAKVFELMLRLKANTVWPAMHACTKPFNDFPENAKLADDYAIVMGSSHAEPMLRNNVGEWKAKPEAYNYVTNRDGVKAYWEERMRTNGRYENIYTVGMRGVHDSGIQGAKTDAERIQILHQVFADQRELIAKWVVEGTRASAALPPDGKGDHAGSRLRATSVEAVPQMFCAYKEVLGLYRQGLKVPDDVTIVWPDDNFGYIRNYATAEERSRRGGFGVYYHVSYLGAPLAYLWLSTTPPALIWEEMSKAYDHGAKTMWIANVGDVKPSEISTEFFLQMAWDVSRWTKDNLPEYLEAWAAREFGGVESKRIARVMAEYYALNFQRRPEHLQWWLGKEKPKPSPFTDDERSERLKRFAGLRAAVAEIERAIPAGSRDGFFELVSYPVVGSALANERYFEGERAALAGKDSPARAAATARAMTADRELAALTKRYHEEIAGGKWRGFINVEPADSQWSFRIKKWELPTYETAPATAAARPEAGPFLSTEAEHFTGSRPGKHGAWATVPGLGRTGDAIAVFPTTAPNLDASAAKTDAPSVDYAFTATQAGDCSCTVYVLPTQPIVAGRGLRFAVAIDDEAPQEVNVNVRDGAAEWAQGVLNASLTKTVTLTIPVAGRHVLHVYGTDAGVVLDKIVIHPGPLPPSYFGPAETR